MSIPAGTPVRLIVDRQEDNTCSDQIAVPQMGVLEDLDRSGLPSSSCRPPSGYIHAHVRHGDDVRPHRVRCRSAGIGGSTIVAVGVLLLVIAGAGYAFWKRGPTASTRGRTAPIPGG